MESANQSCNMCKSVEIVTLCHGKIKLDLVMEDASTLDIKHRLQTKFQLSPDEFRLICNGAELHDEQQVLSAVSASNSTIFMVVKTTASSTIKCRVREMGKGKVAKEITVPSGIRIRDLKKKIHTECKCALPASRQKLVLRGKPLANDYVLGEYVGSTSKCCNLLVMTQPDNEGLIDLNVFLPNHSTSFDVSIRGYDSVGTLKSILLSRGIPATFDSFQLYTKCGQMMDPEKSVSSFNMKNQSDVHFVPGTPLLFQTEDRKRQRKVFLHPPNQFQRFYAPTAKNSATIRLSRQPSGMKVASKPSVQKKKTRKGSGGKGGLFSGLKGGFFSKPKKAPKSREQQADSSAEQAKVVVAAAAAAAAAAVAAADGADSSRKAKKSPMVVNLMGDLLKPSRTPEQIKAMHKELLKRELGGGSFRKMERI